MGNVSIILWALPVAVSLHVTEEFAFPGGFIQWITLHKPRRLKSTFYYVGVNAAAIVAGVIIALVARGIISWSITGGLFFPPMFIVSSWILLADHLINWQSALFVIASAVFVSLFLFPVDVRQKDRS